MLADKRDICGFLNTPEVCDFNKGKIFYQFINKVDKKISKLKTRIKLSKSNSIQKQIKVISCLEVLKKKLVLVYIDKASNNVTIIYKQYYIEVILKEI